MKLLLLLLFMFLTFEANSSELYVYGHDYPKNGENRFLVPPEIKKSILIEYFSVKERLGGMIYILDKDESNTITDQDLFVYHREAELLPSYAKKGKVEIESYVVNVEDLVQIILEYKDRVFVNYCWNGSLNSIKLQKKIISKNGKISFFDINNNDLFDEGDYYWLFSLPEIQ